MNDMWSNIEINNINRNILVSNETVSEDTENNSSEFTDELITNTVGNHMVSCIKLKEDDVLLIVDPTNPSIGVLKNGKIYMLSSVAVNGLEVKPIGNIIFGTDATKNYVEKILESFLTNGDIDFLKEKYGIESQNQVLRSILSEYDTDHYRIK